MRKALQRFIVLAVILIVGFAGCSGTDAGSIEVEEPNTATVCVEWQEGSFTKEVDLGGKERISLLEAMEGMKLDVKNYGGSLGVKILAINDIWEIPKDNLYWFFYLNGEFSTAGVSVLEINKGDHIKWLLKKAD